MSGLTARQKEILARTIESYIETVIPVGSRTLTERYGLRLSPASVRHEMGVLEELGYLTHPYTSAGRIPTDKGYHFYVEESVTEEPVSGFLLGVISQEMAGKIRNLDSLMERASRVLSAMAEEAVLVVSPRLQELCLKELSLVSLDETRLLSVWCCTSGLVQDCVVEMGEAISPEEADRIRNFINEELAGNPIENLEQELLQRIAVRRDSLRRLYERTLQIVRESLSYWERVRVFVEGSRYVLSQPEFQDARKSQLLLTTLEEKSSLLSLLSLQSPEEGIRVAIGEKELSKAIWDCALVSMPYYGHGRQAGTLGILGPRRMPYGRMMGLVRKMAEKMSGALERLGSW